MDAIDKKILVCLTENGRMRASEIASRLEMSVSGVTDRIKKLEAAGVIRGYTALLDPAKVNRGFQALIGISVGNPKYLDILSKELMKNPYVMECYTLTGDYDYMARVSARSSEHFQQIHYGIAKMEGVIGIKTYLVLGTETNPLYDPLAD